MSKDTNNILQNMNKKDKKNRTTWIFLKNHASAY